MSVFYSCSRPYLLRIMCSPAALGCCVLLAGLKKANVLSWLAKPNIELYNICHFVSGLFYLIVFSRFVHVVACIRISFLFKSDYSIVCIYHILFVHFSVDGLLGSFCLLDIVNNEHGYTDTCLSFWFIWVYM